MGLGEWQQTGLIPKISLKKTRINYDKTWYLKFEEVSMKIYLAIFLFSFCAKAGFFSSDFKLDNNPNCYLDLRDVSGNYQETDFISVYNPLSRGGATHSTDPVNVTYNIPKFHVFNCIVHKKNPDLRLCEGGDEFEYKDSNNDIFRTKIIMAERKIFRCACKGDSIW